MAMDMKALYEVLMKTGGDATQIDAIERLFKDTMPVAGRPTSGYLNEGNSPFSLIEGDPISAVVTGGSPLMNWLPSRLVTHRVEPVKHLDWIAPEGFTGAQTYAEWLATLTIPDCGYGPATDWSGFEYMMTGGSFSWSTNMMKPYQDGMSYFEKEPMHQLRGSSIGQPLSSDREWALARLFFASETHLDYVLKHGSADNSVMEWDGLFKILTPGYVQNRRVGSGTPVWADPIIVNGISLATKAAVLQTIRKVVRRLRTRIQSRNWSLQDGDMVVFMSKVMWDNISEEIASGALWAHTNTHNFSGEMSIDDFERRLSATKSGGIGFGTINVDGVDVPVMVDANLGKNGILNPGGTDTPIITGDIAVLTRRVQGMTLLEQQYVDFSSMDYPTGYPENMVQMEQGHMRTGWVTEANKCYYYYQEMGGRVVSYMQPLQAVIQNVSITTLDADEHEAGAFYSEDFYAYNGGRGGTGTAFLTPSG